MNATDNPKPTLRYDHDSGAYIVTYAEGTEEKFFSLNDAIWARDHDGDHAPTLWDILVDLAEARALAASQPVIDPYSRNPLTGHFRGGDRGETS